MNKTSIILKHEIQMNAERIRLMNGQYVRSVKTLIRENRNKVGVKYDEVD